MYREFWNLLNIHNRLLQETCMQIGEISKKIERISKRLDRDVICVNAFKSVAKEVTQRRRILELTAFDDDYEFDFGEEPDETEGGQ